MGNLWDAMIEGYNGSGYGSADFAGMDATDGPVEGASTPWDNLISSTRPRQNGEALGRPRRWDGDASGMAGGIREAADALGIDPVDLATVISYETGGTFDPTQAGPTTKWGQHRGLIQFGEPQAREYGVDWDDPMGSQLGAEGAIVNYMRKAGVRPGMGILDVYSAVNAGSVAAV